ncbi:uncharacterized protein LOC127138052 [Lathyrus oleraceus]|uniref:uncharacterized protein LOC127138052 n=1 Tax=Pisum sativum TaxID=3888 RepID=UPI0021D226E9|nr:uncharacterized protein LOC127138052 [Pisum sativum]
MDSVDGCGTGWNGNIFSIAFALIEGETKDAWSFFLRNLRIHVTPQVNMCLISGIHESIKSAYNNPENGWQYPTSSHVYYIRHITQNFMREIKDMELRKKVVNMGYLLTETTFNYYRGEIRRTNSEALSWIDNIPWEKWARAYDEGQRWGHMTINLAEAMNSIFTDNCNMEMVEEVSKASTHNVMQFDHERFYFMVHEKINHNDGRPTGIFGVDLRKEWCDCGKFQAFQLSCSHIYKESFFGLPHEENWSRYEGFTLCHDKSTLCHDESMIRRKKGRSTSTRIRTEMDNVEKEKRRCGICRKIGHMRRKCPNVA